MPTFARSAAAVGVAFLTACGWYREHFPRREEVFIPVPLAVGERRAIGTDTLWVLEGPAWELRADHQEPLVEARDILDDVVRKWSRYFTEPPPETLTVRFRPADPRRNPSPDTGVARRTRDSVITVIYRAPERRTMGARMVSPRLGLTVAARWLTRRAEIISGVSADASTGHPRVGDWLEMALAARIAGAGDPLYARRRLAALGEDRLLPLAAMFAMHRPRPSSRVVEPLVARNDLPPRSRRERVDTTQLFDMQAHAFAEFLAEKEGEPFLGWLMDEQARGRLTIEALASAAVVPKSIEPLQRAYNDWIVAAR